MLNINHHIKGFQAKLSTALRCLVFPAIILLFGLFWFFPPNSHTFPGHIYFRFLLMLPFYHQSPFVDIIFVLIFGLIYLYLSHASQSLIYNMMQTELFKSPVMNKLSIHLSFLWSFSGNVPGWNPFFLNMTWTMWSTPDLCLNNYLFKNIDFTSSLPEIPFLTHSKGALQVLQSHHSDNQRWVWTS